MRDDDSLARATATAILGIDTLWGGDVMNPSGAGRFIADSWCSDEPLPLAYTHAAAARVRATGGVAAGKFDAAAVAAYLAAVDVAGAIAELNARAGRLGGLRGAYLCGMGECLSVMWELVEEKLGRGPAVPYERCVIASTGRAPTSSEPAQRREQVAALLARQGYRTRAREQLLAAVDDWRSARLVPKKSIPMLGEACIALCDAGTQS
ncbi:MAG TPA: hypothetical protein VMT50_03850, partial [Steroidobacteraceae bacterium]|nr:hypothetical protein [Steroidobacteraceae bacterium]